MNNLEVEKMVSSFDFATFLNPKEGNQENYGAIIIITDKQYIIAYNDYDGLGYHGDSIRKILCEIYQEDRFSPIVTPSFVKENFIIGTMMSGPNMTYLLFNLERLKEITPNQFKLFEELEKKYNDLIKKKAEEKNESIVIFTEEGMEFATKDFELLEKALEKRVSSKKTLREEECIIGESLFEENSLGGRR